MSFCIIATVHSVHYPLENRWDLELVILVAIEQNIFTHD